MICFQAFHVFKILVANPTKPEAIVDILTRNKSKLIRLLENFLPDRLVIFYNFMDKATVGGLIRFSG